MPHQGSDGADTEDDEPAAQDDDTTAGGPLEHQQPPSWPRHPDRVGRVVELTISLAPLLAETQNGATLAAAIVTLILILALTA